MAAIFSLNTGITQIDRNILVATEAKDYRIDLSKYIKLILTAHCNSTYNKNVIIDLKDATVADFIEFQADSGIPTSDYYVMVFGILYPKSIVVRGITSKQGNARLTVDGLY